SAVRGARRRGSMDGTTCRRRAAREPGATAVLAFLHSFRSHAAANSGTRCTRTPGDRRRRSLLLVRRAAARKDRRGQARRGLDWRPGRARAGIELYTAGPPGLESIWPEW